MQKFRKFTSLNDIFTDRNTQIFGFFMIFAKKLSNLFFNDNF